MALLKPLTFALRALSTLAFVAVGAVLLVALLPLFSDAGSYPWVAQVLSFDATLIDGVRSAVPTRLGALEFGRAFLALGVFFGAVVLDYGAYTLSALTSKSGGRPKYARWKKHARKRKKPPASAPTAPNGAQPKQTDKKSREELVRQMVEAKRELDAMTKDVAFLALDVVESTNMKLGEDQAFVEHDFKAFKNMVDEVVAKERPLKSAWTPDGAMICFDSLDRAVRAAQAMLRQLPAFNSGTRMMQTPFRVRCGVNAGRVQYDADTPMEAMSDNAIDIAGHMQKYADPDTVFVAEDLIRRRKVKRGFTPADTEVDGYSVSVWRGPSAR
ncbi:MAG: guanylate cyclase [Gemmatimonadota bacterium]|nr:guanylate cyclase [Gemmatimonadota bacterium]MDH3423097.1 guanylate cyclase [Gemmatimonadota bacterium]